MTDILIQIFLIAFFLNLAYEVWHSVLYKTCIEAPLKRYIFLIYKAAVFDGIVISAIYYATCLIFRNQNIFSDFYQLAVFLLINLIFAYLWEVYSLSKKKWIYSEKMPLVLGVGLTPLVQLPLAGFFSVYFTFYF